jgi:multidrug resistance protein, MATE family
MQTRGRQTRIVKLALPIIGGMLSQNVLNLVDTLMVSSLGDAALAAVGIASFANFMCIAFITGLSAGVQAISARRLGEGRDSELAVPLNGGLLLALVLGGPMTLVLLWMAPQIIDLLIEQRPIAELATPYLQARLWALVAVGMNFSFRGYLNGVNRSGLYFRTLLLMHATNIAVSYVLIFGALGAPELGVLGAGIGSAVATFVGTGAYLVVGLRHARHSGFLRALPAGETLRTMLRLALPAGFQQFFFATGMTAFFAIIGRVGTAELAASNVLLNLLLVALLPSMGFGLASASLVGQALGRGEPKDAQRWAWDVVRIASLLVGVLSLFAFLFPDLLLSLFLHDPRTLALARLPFRLIVLGMPIDTVGLVLMHSLMGAGDNRSVLVVSVGLQWLLLLPAVYLLGPVLGLGLVGIWGAQLAYRALQTGVFVTLWQREGWSRVAV